MFLLNDTARDMLLLFGLVFSSLALVKEAKREDDDLMFWLNTIAVVIFGILAIYIALELMGLIH